MDPLLDQVQLRRGRTTVRVLPVEGAVAVDLVVDGLAVLARTPWTDTVTAADEPAADEATWVSRWHGGWQACLPTTGQPDSGDPRQGFHGAASQAPWTVVDRSVGQVELTWTSGDGLHARRRWTLLPDGLQVEAELQLDSGTPRAVAVAEHLVLGSDLLAGVEEPDGALRVEPPPGTILAPLDYQGRPAGGAVAWPGPEGGRRGRVGPHTPARVAALLDVAPATIRVVGPRVAVVVRWSGLPHALLWEEIGASTEPPWGGAVRALAIEPTTTPHGAGLLQGDGALVLHPGGRLRWRVSLEVRCGTAREGEP